MSNVLSLLLLGAFGYLILFLLVDAVMYLGTRERVLETFSRNRSRNRLELITMLRNIRLCHSREKKKGGSS